MKVHRLAENIYRRTVYCRTEERVSFASGSEVGVVMFVTLDNEGEYKLCVLNRYVKLSINVLS